MIQIILDKAIGYVDRLHLSTNGKHANWDHAPEHVKNVYIDRAVHEFAAQAAGAKDMRFTLMQDARDFGFCVDFGQGVETFYPMVNTKDAQFLADKLGVQIKPMIEQSRFVLAKLENEEASIRFFEDLGNHDGDIQAAQRSAITMVAACYQASKSMRLPSPH